MENLQDKETQELMKKVVEVTGIPEERLRELYTLTIQLAKKMVDTIMPDLLRLNDAVELVVVVKATLARLANTFNESLKVVLDEAQQKKHVD